MLQYVFQVIKNFIEMLVTAYKGVSEGVAFIKLSRVLYRIVYLRFIPLSCGHKSAIFHGVVVDRSLH